MSTEAKLEGQHSDGCIVTPQCVFYIFVHLHSLSKSEFGPCRVALGITGMGPNSMCYLESKLAYPVGINCAIHNTRNNEVKSLEHACWS